MAKIVKCKTCGADMASNAKACPQCGAKNKKPIFKRWWFWVICVIVLLVVVSSASGGSKTVSTNEAVNSQSETSEETVAATETSVEAEGTESVEEVEPAETESYEITDTHFDYYVNSIGSTEYRAWVEITNTGTTNLYMDSCTFDFEDNDGHLLQTENFISSCPYVIAPGEKGYFYNNIGSLQIDDGVSLDNGINFVPQVSVKTARKEPVNYEVSDTDLRAGTFDYPTLTGRVTNTTDEDDSLLYVQAIYYDATGNVLAITGTNITDFTAGKTASFEISGIALGDGVTLDTIADYKVVAQATYYQFG